MKNTLFKILIIITLLFPIHHYAQPIVTPEELKTLLGEWSGTLTYTDYSSNKPFIMPANLIVNPGKNKLQLILNINYPEEPNANSKDKIKISKNGTQLNKRDIKSKQILPNGQIKITTEYPGKDNRKKAIIRNTYVIGKNTFTIRKEVKFNNSDDWIMRNEYNYSR